MNHAGHESSHSLSDSDFETEKSDTAALMLHLGHILTNRKQFSAISRLRVFILLPASLHDDGAVADRIQKRLRALIHETRLGVEAGQIDVMPWPVVDGDAPTRAERCAALSATVASTSGVGSSVVLLDLPQVPADDASGAECAAYVEDIRTLSSAGGGEQAMVFLQKNEQATLSRRRSERKNLSYCFLKPYIYTPASPSFCAVRRLVQPHHVPVLNARRVLCIDLDDAYC